MLNYQMLNYETDLKTGEIFLTTNKHESYGIISHVNGLGFFLWINEVLFSKAFYASQNKHGCIPAFKSLEAIKCFALSLYLEHGAE